MGKKSSGSGTNSAGTCSKSAGLGAKFALLYVAAVVVLAAIFFIPAGSLDYWQAWAYIATLLLPAAFAVSYFLKHDPELLRRRMEMKEKEGAQKKIVGVSGILFLIGFLLPGFDFRYGWSSVPVWLVLLSDLAVLCCYLMVFLVFRENSYASRVIKVEKGQKVISTGPYSFVRHPMYLGVMAMYLFTPLALGSYWALPAFLPIVPLLVIRIQNEEEVLRRELKGYSAYCKKTRYRLIPHVW